MSAHLAAEQDAPDLVALARAEASLREFASVGRRRVDAGALVVLATEGDPTPFLTVAVPGGGPEPEAWAPSVALLVEAFPEPSATPRLEFMTELHPGLEAALLAAGFRRTASAPVLVAAAAAWVDPPARHAGAYRDLADLSAVELERFVVSQSLAFGMPLESGRAFLPLLRGCLPDGRILGGALELGDRPVSGATLQVAPSGAELAGVFTDAGWRRRGLAFATCAELLRRARAVGVATAWLSAAKGAEGVYRRLGFHAVGTQTNVARRVG